MILTEEQYDLMCAGDGVIERDWFGNGQSIPVMGSFQDALISFEKAPAKIKGKPFRAVLFHIPLTTYHRWVDNDLMVKTPHVNGYRIFQNINVKEIDPYYKARPVA